MKISTKGRYALRIMIDVAQDKSGVPVRISEISERLGISLKYTEQIACLLAKGGLLRSTRGAQGGYELVRTPAEYTVREILTCTEGELAPVACAKENFPCERSSSCGTRALWSGLFTLTSAYFDAVTLADLLDPTFTPERTYAIIRRKL